MNVIVIVEYHAMNTVVDMNTDLLPWRPGRDHFANLNACINNGERSNGNIMNNNKTERPQKFIQSRWVILKSSQYSKAYA